MRERKRETEGFYAWGVGRALNANARDPVAEFDEIKQHQKHSQIESNQSNLGRLDGLRGAQTADARDWVLEDDGAERGVCVCRRVRACDI